MSPKQQYLSEIEQGVLIEDSLQLVVVDAFERLYLDLLKPQKNGFFGKSKTPKGIYVSGSVGRGKTHLMDLFYESLPATVQGMRQHYHEFMLWVHGQLRSLKGKSDPLDHVVKKLAKTNRLICLDEFLVNDITNAMLLAGLLQAFERYGIALVTTSNVKPVDLYKNGLQRAKFQPAIKWIQLHMQVLELDGEKDYRYKAAQLSLRWYFPLNQSCEYHLNDVFDRLAADKKVSDGHWLINQRKLAVKRCAGDVLWCDFEALCMQARAASDYIEICKKCAHMLISGIPKMSKLDDDAARRFLTLIDVMYDHDVLLTASAEAHYESIYSGHRLAFEFERAVSRINELVTRV